MASPAFHASARRVSRPVISVFTDMARFLTVAAPILEVASPDRAGALFGCTAARVLTHPGSRFLMVRRVFATAVLA
ncbi:hypothetical protein GCM10018952_15770 [Streptosporangium vulgare]